MILRLHLLMIAIALLQLCFCVVIRENRKTDPFDRFRNLLLSIPNVESTKVDRFTDLVRNVMAPNRGKAGMLEVLFSGTNITKDEQSEMVVFDRYMTDEDLLNIETNLNNKLTSNETQKIMKILQKFGAAETKQDYRDAVIEVMVHAIHTALNIQDDCLSKQTIVDFENRKINVIQDQEQYECKQ